MYFMERPMWMHRFAVNESDIIIELSEMEKKEVNMYKNLSVGWQTSLMWQVATVPYQTIQLRVVVVIARSVNIN